MKPCNPFAFEESNPLYSIFFCQLLQNFNTKGSKGLSFQPYAESENQNNTLYHLKREVTHEGFCYDASEVVAAKA